MEFTDAMTGYFKAEQDEAQILMLLGFVLLMIGLYGSFFSNKNLMRGMGYVLIPAALIFGIVGTIVYFRTDAQVLDLLKLHGTNPAQFQQVEGARMQSVIDSFQIYFFVYLAALVLAPPLFWFGKEKVWRGLALGLIIFAAVGLVIDGFASARAQVYKKAIDQMDVGVIESRATGSEQNQAPEE